MSTSQQFCTFFLEGSLFGVPVPQVQEVIRFHQMTAVPLAPDRRRGEPAGRRDRGRHRSGTVQF